MRQANPFVQHPDAAYVDDLDVFDCKQPTMVIAEETLLGQNLNSLYHYKWGDPHYVSLTIGTKLVPGSVGLTAQTIACYEGSEIPAVSKKQLSNMSFELLSSTITGDGDLFYKVLSGKQDAQNEKRLLFISKFYNEREVPLAQNTSIPERPKFKTEVDTAVLNCKENRIFGFENEYYDASDKLVYLRAPVPVPENVTEWQDIKDVSSPILQLRNIICDAGEAQK